MHQDVFAVCAGSLGTTGWCVGLVMSAVQVRVDFEQPGQLRRVKQSGKWLSQHVLSKSKKK
jgi:hypothetical protein